MKKIVIVTLITMLSAGIFAQSTNNDGTPTKQHKVVIQLSSNDTLVSKSLIGNINHLKQGWGKSVQIEMVAHGAGIELLMAAKTTQQISIHNLKKMGVVFVGCENTMIIRKISKEEIISEADFVPMGVGEIVMKQEDGWSYLKAGF